MTSEKTVQLQTAELHLYKGEQDPLVMGGRSEGIQPPCEYLGFAAAAPDFFSFVLSTLHFIWGCLLVAGQPDLHEITG